MPLAKTESTVLEVAPVYRVQQPAGTAAGQYAVGRIDLAEGRVDAAIQRFRNALQPDRGFAEAHNGLGVAYGQQGRFAEAADAFRAALVITPEAPHVLNNLGFAQLKAGQLDEAWATLKRSLVLDSRNKRTRENLELLASVRAAALAEAARGVTPAATAAAGASPAPVAAVAPQAPVSESVPVSAPIAAAIVKPVAACRSPRRGPRTRSSSPAPTRARWSSLRRTCTNCAPILRHRRRPLRLSLPLPPLSPPQPLPIPYVAAGSDAPRTAQASKRPVATASLAALDGIEVSNGVGIRYLAGRTARTLSRLGVTVARVSDYRLFGRQQRPRSTTATAMSARRWRCAPRCRWAPAWSKAPVCTPRSTCAS